MGQESAEGRQLHLLHLRAEVGEGERRRELELRPRAPAEPGVKRLRCEEVDQAVQPVRAVGSVVQRRAPLRVTRGRRT